MRKSIGIVQPELIYPRGAERQVCELASHLNREGWKVTIYCFNHDKDYPFNNLLEGVEVTSLNKNYVPIYVGAENVLLRLLHFFRIQFQNIFFIYLLSKKLKKHLFLNAHNYPAHWISFFTDQPVIWTCNEPPYWFYYPQRGLAYLFFLPFKIIDLILSSKIKFILSLDGRMQKIIAGAYRKTVEIVGSGAELTHPIRQKLEKDVINLLFVGELHPQKRPKDIIKVLKNFKNQKQSFVLHLVGSGEQEEKLKHLAAKEKVNVIFHGRVSNEVLYSLFSITNIGIFVPEKQPWGIFPLETLMAKIPTIISDECGVLDVLGGIRSVVIVKTGDANGLTRAIHYIVDNYPSLKRQLNKEAASIQKKVSWTGYTKRFLDLTSAYLGK